VRSIETEGRTIDEAVAAALKQLQVERERVEIEVLAQATKGFLGIGGKKARVRATLREPLSVQLTEPEARPPQQRERARPAELAGEPVAEAAPLSPEVGIKACGILSEILRLMGTEAKAALETRTGETVINITGGPEGFLIGHRGQTLDALEYLLNRIITRSDDSEAHVALDVEGYRERRWKSLENLALRLGERAKRRRKTVTLSPLSPRDRRVIHLTLEGDPLVTTKSMGRGYFRQVCIVPEEGARRERGKGAARAQSSE
jgi:spoIIIJ-associated protein